MEELIPVVNTSAAIDTLVSQVQVICQHTDTSTGWPFWFNFITMCASIITIASIALIIIEFYHFKIKKRCNRLILQDFIRHLFVNIGIVEVIRIKMQEDGHSYKNSYPEEGVFKRLAFLTEDCNFEKFATKAENYDKIHEVELLMRNYNIAAEIACKHFINPAIPEEIKREDLDVLTRRAITLIKIFTDLGSLLKIKIEPLLIIMKTIENDIASIDCKDFQFTTRSKELNEFLTQNNMTEIMNKYIKLRHKNYVTIIQLPEKE